MDPGLFGVPMGEAAEGSSRRSRTTAYLLWFLGLGGLLGLHRFYLGDTKQGWIELVTLGGLGVLAARDLMGMERLVDRANRLQRVPAPSTWAGPGLPGRWRPIMWRGRLVAAAFALSIVLAILAPWDLSLAVLISWILGVWSFTVGVVIGGRLLPLYVPAIARWHYRLSGRAPGEPLARIERHPRETLRVDPVPDEAFLPLAAAMAIAFRLASWGPTIPGLAEVITLGFPVTPLAAGVIFPFLRAPVAAAFRSVRRDADGRISSSRPIGQRAQLYFGLTFVLGALVEAYLAREAGLFTLVFSLAVPILVATAWYDHDRLARDVRRFEEALVERLEGDGG